MKKEVTSQQEVQWPHDRPLQQGKIKFAIGDGNAENMLDKLQKNSRNKKIMKTSRGARGVMVIVVGSGHGDTSSNLDCNDLGFGGYLMPNPFLYK